MSWGVWRVLPVLLGVIYKGEGFVSGSSPHRSTQIRRPWRGPPRVTGITLRVLVEGSSRKDFSENVERSETEGGRGG